MSFSLLKKTPRLAALAGFYLAAVLLFMAAKPCFVLAQSAEKRAGFVWSEMPSILWHGLPLDLATAGYASVPLWLLLGATLWARVPHLRALYRTYTGIAAIVLALVFVGDACLYNFWGTKLDGTVWAYLAQPKGVFASLTPTYAIGAFAAITLVALLFGGVFARTAPKSLPKPSRRLLRTAGWLLTGGILFVAIRGGVGKGTANVGMAYYCDKPFCNHAAANPAFSLFSSIGKNKDYAKEYDYFKEDERKALFDSLAFSTQSVESEQLLNTPRPNVLIVIMEGCCGTFVHAVDSLASPAVTPNLNRLAREGVLFSRCYANSFRTDRGTLSILSGYPAFPGVSVMKKEALCAKLPSIARTLSRAGYSTEFLYGGDIKFTNTNGYLLATGYERTYGDTSFSADERRTHSWGVTDRITFDRLFEMVTRYPANRPWHLGFLTLASHEPWKVPYDRIKGDEKANAMAYLDDCVGKFVTRLRQTPQWDNTLIVLLPDHGIEYPDGLPHSDTRRAHIPMIWTGGAVKGSKVVDKTLNQSDLAATLLGQMGLPHADFRFSRDVLSRTYTRPSAADVYPDLILWKDSTGETVIDLTARPERVLRDTPAPSAARQRAARAYLQTIHDELGNLLRQPANLQEK